LRGWTDAGFLQQRSELMERKIHMGADLGGRRGLVQEIER
jgi:hypothetical protein